MEIALEFFKTVGAYLQDVNKEGFNMCVLLAFAVPNTVLFASPANFRASLQCWFVCW